MAKGDESQVQRCTFLLGVPSGVIELPYQILPLMASLLSTVKVASFHVGYQLCGRPAGVEDQTVEWQLRYTRNSVCSLRTNYQGLKCYLTWAMQNAEI